MITTDELAQVPFFDHLDDEERSLLAGITRRTSARAGEHLFEQGEPSRTLFVIVAGLLSLRQTMRGGKEEFTMAAARPGEVIGISSLHGEDAIHPSTGICLEDTELIEIDAKVLMQTLQSRPAVGFRILRRLTRLLAERLAAARAQLGSQTRPGFISHG